jgi:hypothetical protein
MTVLSNKRKRSDSFLPGASTDNLLADPGCAYLRKRSKSLGMSSEEEEQHRTRLSLSADSDATEHFVELADDDVDAEHEFDDDDEFEFDDESNGDSDEYVDESDPEFSNKSSRITKKSSSSSPSSKNAGTWRKKDDDALMRAVKNYDSTHHNSKKSSRDWKAIAATIAGKTEAQCANRWQKVLNPTLIKGPWTVEEDELLRQLVNEHGPRQWTKIASLMKGRVGKQCNERWHNHLAPELRKGPFTPEEDRILIQKQAEVGNKWAIIATFLPGRAQNTIKNRWNATLKRRRPTLTKSSSSTALNSSSSSSSSSSSVENSPKRAAANNTNTIKSHTSSTAKLACAMPIASGPTNLQSVVGTNNLSATLPTRSGRNAPRKLSLDDSTAPLSASVGGGCATPSFANLVAFDATKNGAAAMHRAFATPAAAPNMMAGLPFANNPADFSAIPDSDYLMPSLDSSSSSFVHEPLSSTEWPNLYQAPIPTYSFGMSDDFDVDVDATFDTIPDTLFEMGEFADIPGISSPLAGFDSYDDFLFLNDMDALNNTTTTTAQSAPSQVRC